MDDLDRQIEQAGKMTRAVAQVLSDKARRESNLRKLLGGFSLLIGAAVGVLSLSGLMEKWFGVTGLQFAAAATSGILILDVVAPKFLGPEPDRYRDYAWYIAGYADRFAHESVNPQLTAEERKVRLTELLRLAMENLRDVNVKWPDLYQTATNNTRI